MSKQPSFVAEVLAKFGLNEKEVVIYLACVRLQETSPFALAKETGIARTTIYDLLMNLARRGLIDVQQSDGFSKQQTKVRVKNPSYLRELIREQQKALQNLEVDLVTVLPELHEQFHGEQSHSNTRFYPGVEGVRHVYRVEDQVSQPLVAFENLLPMDVFGIDTTNQMISVFTQELLKRRSSMRELAPNNEWTHHAISYQYGRDPNYIKARHIRLIDNPLYNLQQRTVVAGDQVHIVTATEQEVWGMIIASKSLATTWRSIFELLWQQGTPVTAELVESWGPNKYLEAELSQRSAR